MNNVPLPGTDASTKRLPRCAGLLHRPGLPHVALLLLVIVFFGLIRYRLRDMPLERDEGEYALSGQLMLQGIPPYKLAYNLKLPGTYAAYAAILAVFGQSPAGIHLGFLFLNAVTSLLMYFLGAHLFGRLAGVVAGASYALLSTSPTILGFQAHATHFIVLPAIVSILLLLSALDSGRSWLFFASGLFSGVAILMKQHGAFVPVFCFLYLIVNVRRQERTRDFDGARPEAPTRSRPGAPSKLRLGGDFSPVRPIAFFVFGVILPFAITCWLLYRAGVFSQFWFWTVSYAGEYSKMGLRRGLRVFSLKFQAVAAPTVLTWFWAGLGIVALRRSPSARRHAWFLITFLLLAFLAICPGVQFRPHYFVLVLPPVALLAGVGVSSATEILARACFNSSALKGPGFSWADGPQQDRALAPAGIAFPLKYGSPRYLIALPSLAFLACFAGTIFQQRTFYFSLTPEQAVRAAYPADSEIFLAAPTIALYLRDHASPSATIAVVGSEPEIYFYAHRLPATGYLYMYSLMERQKYTAQMRQQMIHEVETNRPESLVLVDAWDSWGYQDSTAPHVVALFSWAKEYIGEHYTRVGVVNLGDPIYYIWGDEAQLHPPHSDQALYVFKRKN